MAKFKVGKEYKVRDGSATYRITSITLGRIHGGFKRPIVGVNVDYPSEVWNWCEDGTFNPPAIGTDPMDLMSDEPEQAMDDTDNTERDELAKQLLLVAVGMPALAHDIGKGMDDAWKVLASRCFDISNAFVAEKQRRSRE